MGWYNPSTIKIAEVLLADYGHLIVKGLTVWSRSQII